MDLFLFLFFFLFVCLVCQPVFYSFFHKFVGRLVRSPSFSLHVRGFDYLISLDMKVTLLLGAIQDNTFQVINLVYFLHLIATHCFDIIEVKGLIK